MKWGIVILLVLGFVAAACAAVLVGAVQFNPFAKANESATVDAIVADQALLAMQVMEDHHFSTKQMPRADLPLGCLKSSEAAVGRVLAVSVVAGQILQESDFVWRGTGAELAAKIPAGMRAFTIHLSKAVPDRIIMYPGCIVDVMFTSKLSGGDRGQAVTLTILQGIQVLAVGADSIISTPTPGQSTANKPSSRARGMTVTVQVDPYQAEALQLASDNGTLSLTLRSPLDKIVTDSEGTVLNQNKLTRGITLSTDNQSPAQGKQNGTGDPNGPTAKPGKVQPTKTEPDIKSRIKEIIVHRGSDTKTEEVEGSEQSSESEEGTTESKNE